MGLLKLSCFSGKHKLVFTISIVTPAAVMIILNECGIQLEGKNVLVIGRSRIVGLPLAYALSKKGSTITLAHSETVNLSEACMKADIVIPATGHVGLVQGNWMKSGSVLINVGTSFEGSNLEPDLSDSSGSFDHVTTLSTCPGGVGPMSVAILFRNVVDSASRSMQTNFRPRKVQDSIGATKHTPSYPQQKLLHWVSENSAWSISGGENDGISFARKLTRNHQFKSHSEVADFVKAITEVSDRLNHHMERFGMSHECHDGVRAEISLSTYTIKDVTELDLQLAEEIDKYIKRITGDFEVKSGKTSKIPHAVVKDYSYILPEEKIAKFPSSPRDSSRLLIGIPSDNSTSNINPLVNGITSGEQMKITDMKFRDLSTILPSDVHLVFNESRVFAARFFAHYEGRKDAPATEVLLLSPAFNQDPGHLIERKCDGSVKWRVMVRSDNLMPGSKLVIREDNGSEKLLINIEMIYGKWEEDDMNDGIEACASFSSSGGQPSLPLSHYINKFGSIPLPPYIKREVVEQDENNYQTVYSSMSKIGSVAAPTAGLHFSPQVISDLTGRGIRMSNLVLHVGAGTFKPVVANNISDHEMHKEQFSIRKSELEAIADSLDEGKSVIAVGTTSARVLESLYWLGVKSATGTLKTPQSLADMEDISDRHNLDQWEPYSESYGHISLPVSAAFRELSTRLNVHGDDEITGSTSLCIAPGYNWHVVSGLITNFHAPDSTLMMLVSSFLGSKQKVDEIYNHVRRRRLHT